MTTQVNLFEDLPADVDLSNIQITVPLVSPDGKLISASAVKDRIEMIVSAMESSEVPNELKKRVLEELVDPKYVNVAHYGMYAYRSLKCKGPLCRLRESQYQQLIRMRRAYRDGRFSAYLRRAARGSSNTHRFDASYIYMLKLVQRMLLNQGREVPLYLQMVLDDPNMENEELWFAFIQEIENAESAVEINVGTAEALVADEVPVTEVIGEIDYSNLGLDE